MSTPGCTAESGLRAAILTLLAGGRVVSTSEIRVRLADTGFPGLHQERVYRLLHALARTGCIYRIHPPAPTRTAFWSTRPPDTHIARQGAPVTTARTPEAGRTAPS